MANEILHVQFGELFKFNKQSDGSLQVFGKATDETLDGDMQKCDLAWSSKALTKWLATGGNVRVQHNPSLYPAGVGLSLDTKPDGVYLMAEISEPTAIRLTEKGALRAFSVGISHPKFARDATAPNGRIIGGDIVEVSIVDRPSNPECAFTMKVAGADNDTTDTAFVGEYTVLPPVSSALNKIMDGTLLTKTSTSDEDNGEDDGDDVDVSDAGDSDDNGDGGDNQDGDSDGDGSPDSKDDADADNSDDDDSKKTAKVDEHGEGISSDTGEESGDLEEGRDSTRGKAAHAEDDQRTEPADGAQSDGASAKQIDGQLVDPLLHSSTYTSEALRAIGKPESDSASLVKVDDGDSTDPEDVGNDDDSTSDANSTDMGDADVEVILDELVADLGGGDGADDPDDADELDTDGDTDDATDKSAAVDTDEPRMKFVGWAMRRLHDVACPAYSTDVVKSAYPSVNKDGLGVTVGPTAQRIIYALLQSKMAQDDGSGTIAYEIEQLAKSYNQISNFVASAIYSDVAAMIAAGTSKEQAISDVMQSARDELRVDAGIEDTEEAGTLIRAKSSRVFYSNAHKDSAANALQAIHDTVTGIFPDLCTLPAPSDPPVEKSVKPDLAKAAVMDADERIAELGTAWDAERADMLAQIEKLSGMPDMSKVQRRASAHGAIIEKSLTVTDAAEAAAEVERRNKMAWLETLSVSAPTASEREAAEVVLEKMRTATLTK